MALDYGALYPAQTDTDAAYPQGKARNVSAPGAGDGTPFTADMLNDIWGFLQCILKNTGTDPSGIPDTANTSQYLGALGRLMFGTLVASNWMPTYPSGTEQYNTVCYSPDLDLWVIMGENGVYRFSSDSFYTWSAGTIPGNPDINAVCWSSDLSLFIAVGDGGVIYTSPDGNTWTGRVSGTASDLLAVAVKPGSPDTVVAVGLSSTIVYSSNGIAWSSATSTSTNRFGIAWSSTLSLFVSVGLGADIETSPDGVTWTNRGTAPSAANHRAVAWSAYHGLFVAAGSGGNVDTSPDGINWTSAGPVTGAGVIYGVAVDETLGMTIVVGADGIQSTFDHSTWHKRLVQSGIDYRAAAFASAHGFTGVVGDGGVALGSLRGLHS